MSKTLAAAAFALLLAAPTPARACDPCVSCLQEPFTKMEQALRAKKETLFAKQWHPEGYAKNLVGGSGLAGRRVYRQGSHKKWYLAPDFSKMRGVPGRACGPWIVPTKIWSWKKKRAVDKIWALVVYYKKSSVLLGGGEKLAQVEALGVRWVAKKPLAPPKK